MSAGTDDRLAQIEARLLKIENYLRATSIKPAGATSGVVPPQAPPTPTTQPQPSIAARAQGNWLGMVAVICFVLAAGFIVKLSIESGWLTQARQIGLAAMFGFSLIAAGFALMKSDREYASLLPGTGIIVLYLTTFAAHRFYGLIPFETAIMLVGLVSGFCIWLYTQIKHDVYAVTAALGAYLSPAILGFNADAAFSLYYFLLCSVAFAAISIWVQSRILTLVSSYLAILMSAAIGAEIHQDMLVACILAAHFFVFTLGTYVYSTQNHAPLSEQDSWIFLPVLLLFYAMEYHFIEQIQAGLAPWISLGFAGVLIGLYLSAKKYFPDSLGSQSMVLAFTSVVLFHSVYLELLPAHATPWLFVLIMLGVAYSPFQRSLTQPKAAYTIPCLAVVAILVIEYGNMLFHLLDSKEASWRLVSLAAFGSLWAVIVNAGDQRAENKKYGHTLLVAAHLLAIVGCYRLTTEIGSLAVSASWLFYAVGVMAFAFKRQDEPMAKSALFVLGFAAGKALLYDAASAPTVVRIGCLLLTGAVLYGCGLLMRKIAHWKVERTV